MLCRICNDKKLSFKKITYDILIIVLNKYLFSERMKASLKSDIDISLILM